MDDGADARPRPVDLRMDEDLAVSRSRPTNDPPLEVHEEQVLGSDLLEPQLVGLHPEGVGPRDTHGGMSPDVVALPGHRQNAAGARELAPEVGLFSTRGARTTSGVCHSRTSLPPGIVPPM